MNHTDSLGAKQLFTPLRFRCQQVFFHFRESFFSRPRRGNSLARGRLMSHFQTRVKNFFLPSGKISFPVALSDVASSLARTALCAFSTPPSSIFTQKILRISSSLTGYSINMPKRHRKILGFFFTLFHFLLPFLPGKNHTFPARESIIVSPGNDAPLSPCFGFSLSRHQRTHRKEKLDRTQRPGCDIESTVCCPFPQERRKAKAGNLPLTCAIPSKNRRSPQKMQRGSFPGGSPTKDPLLSAQQVSILRGLPEPSSSFPRPGP